MKNARFITTVGDTPPTSFNTAGFHPSSTLFIFDHSIGRTRGGRAARTHRHIRPVTVGYCLSSTFLLTNPIFRWRVEGRGFPHAVPALPLFAYTSRSVRRQISVSGDDGGGVWEGGCFRGICASRASSAPAPPPSWVRV